MCECSSSCSCGNEIMTGPPGLRGSRIRTGTGDPSILSTDLIWDKYINEDRELWNFTGTAWVNTGIVLGEDGSDGANAYIYIRYASDNSGTGFSATASDSLKYIAIKNSTTVIPSPIAEDFTGLWVKYIGDDGDAGDDGSGYGGTSTTSLTITVANKTLVTQTGLAYNAASRVRLTSDSVTTLFMEGPVVSYNTSTGSMVVGIDNVFGNSGTKADWSLSLIGEPGENGISVTGATGPGYYATSATTVNLSSTTVPTAITITTQAGLAYSAGARVRIYNTGNYLEGVVSSYSGTTLIFTADRKVGSGSFSSWTINIAGDPGADSETVASNPVLFKAVTTETINYPIASNATPIGQVANRVAFLNSFEAPAYYDNGENFDGFSYTVPAGSVGNMRFAVENFKVDNISSGRFQLQIVLTPLVGSSSVIIQTSSTAGMPDFIDVGSGVFILPRLITASAAYTAGDVISVRLKSVDAATSTVDVFANAVFFNIED